MSTVMTIGNRVDPSMKYDVKPTKRMTSITVYAMIEDMNELSHATYRDNREFYYVNLHSKYRQVTDLMVVDISGERFELVTRRHVADRVNFIDTTCVINKDSFEALKYASDVGFKHLYLKFPIPGTSDFWEASAFYDNNGAIHPWIRLELFTDNLQGIEDLPFKASRFIVEGDPDNPRENLDLVAELWSRGYSRIDTSDVIKS